MVCDSFYPYMLTKPIIKLESHKHDVLPGKFFNITEQSIFLYLTVELSSLFLVTTFELSFFSTGSTQNFYVFREK